jgi:biotin-(acetyl-CoA carboxylase) ligase
LFVHILILFLLGVGLNIDNNYPTICINQFSKEKVTPEGMLVQIVAEFKDLARNFSSATFSDEINTYLYKQKNISFYETSERYMGKYEILEVDSDGFLVLVSKEQNKTMRLSPNKYSFNFKEKIIRPIIN